MARATVSTLASEQELAEAWQARHYPPEGLVDSLGRPFSVVFAGRRWGGPGPDFQGALLALADGSLLRGDVELHRRASDWVRHGHDRDPAYGRVMLHVVQLSDAPTVDIYGRVIPQVVLRLEARAERAPVQAVERPCRHDAEELLRVVQAAGRERFLARAARFEGDVAALGADRALWRGLAEALGYSRNSQPMQRLADLVPWSEARWHGHVALAARLLATAGLEDAATPAEMACLQEQGGVRPQMGPGAWDRAATRLANDPARRVRGLAALAERFSSGGLTDGLLAGMHADRPRTVVASVCASPWIGHGRALVLLANVLLPFGHALGVGTAEALYARLPPEPSNRPSVFMAGQLFGPGWRARSMAEQQGLIGLFKGACQVRACDRCPAWSGADLLSLREPVARYG